MGPQRERMLDATETFKRLVQTTLGVSLDAPVPRAFKAVSYDRKVREAALSAVPDLQLMEDESDVATAAAELAEFESKLQARKSGSLTTKRANQSLGWSKDAPAYQQLLTNEAAKGVVNSRLKSEAYVLAHFTQLKLCNLNVSKLDAGLKRFPNLTELNVSGNRLTELKNLPASIVSVCAYANDITSVVVASPPLAACIHVGIGYNRLADAQLTPVIISFPNVVVLDVSFNSLTNLDFVASKLELLCSLEHLVLFGNPCALVYGYRRSILSTFPRLKSLDDILIPEDFTASAAGESPYAGQVVFAAQLCDLAGLVTVVDILGPPVESAADVGKGGSKPVPAAAAKKGADKKGAPVVEEPVVPEPVAITEADAVLYATLALPNNTVHTSLPARVGVSSAKLDEKEAVLMFSPTPDLRDAFLREKAMITLYERPKKSADSIDPPVPIALAKCALSVSDLLQPSSSERITACATCKLEVTELPTDVLAALQTSANRKIIQAAQPVEDASPGKKPAAKGKPAAPEPVVDRDLTPEEAEAAAKEFKDSRKNVIAKLDVCITVRLSLVLSGEVPV